MKIKLEVDYETTLSLGIEVSARNNNDTFYERFTIEALGSISSALLSISLDKTDIDENQPKGSIVGTFSTKDLNDNTSHVLYTYSLIEGAYSVDNNKFKIYYNQLKTQQPFNFEI